MKKLDNKRKKTKSSVQKSRKKADEVKLPKQEKLFELSRSVFLGGSLLVCLIVLGIYFVQDAFGVSFPLSVVAVMLGFLFELRRRIRSTSSVLMLLLCAFLLSLFSFLPYKKESLADYDFVRHVEMWPFIICMFVLLGACIAFREKISEPLTEGIVLLQSLSVLYWLWSVGAFDVQHGGMTTLVICIALGFIAFSLCHAFSYIHLTTLTRFVLGFWSTLALAALGGWHISRVFQSDAIEMASTLQDVVLSGVQYFLLGTSCLYVLSSILLLLEFMPTRNTFFNARYFKEVRASADFHVARVSSMQVRVWESALCVLFTLGFFFVNERYDWLPWHTSVWLVFALFPLALHVINWLLIHIGRQPHDGMNEVILSTKSHKQ